MATKSAQKEPLVSPELQAVIDGKAPQDAPPISGNKRMLTPPPLKGLKPSKGPK